MYSFSSPRVISACVVAGSIVVYLGWKRIQTRKLNMEIIEEMSVDYTEVPDISPGVSPDVSPEVSPDVSPDVSPGVSPDMSVPDMSPDMSVPDVSPDTSEAQNIS